MKRFFPYTILVLLPLLTFAQNKVIIPNDPSIITGKMTNGLTFYLVKDAEFHKGHADFYMVQKWGTSVEQTTEKGMTSLLAGMNLTESRGFPNGTMFSSLGTLGVPLDNSLVFDVSADNVIMGLKNIPVTNPAAVDDVLSALINMCSGADPNEGTIKSGISFHSNNAVRRQTPALRERNDLLRVLFPECANPVEIDDIAKANALQVWDFQKRWFRPATQALVIIGDINVDSIIGKISLLARTLPQGDQVTVPPQAIELKKGEEFFHSYTDRESVDAAVTVDFLYAPLPPQDRNTPVSLVQNYIHSLLRYIIDKRLDALVRTSSFPISAYEVVSGNFYDLNEINRFGITLHTTPPCTSDAAEFLSAFIEKLKEGITEDDFISASRWYQSKSSEKPNFTEGVFNHFLKGENVFAVKDKTEYTAKLKTTFTRNQMNSYIKSFLENDTYRIIHSISPLEISEKELREAFQYGKGIHLNDGTKATVPQVNTQTATIKEPVKEPITGSLLYILPNHSKVYFKRNTDGAGKVSVKAIAKAGLSSADRSCVFISRYMNRLAPLTLPDIPYDHDIQLFREFTPDRSFLTGQCSTADLELLFRLINHCFTDISIEETAFISKMEELTRDEIHRFNSPEFRLHHFSSGYLKFRQDYTPLDFHIFEDFLKKTCTNISNYTFLISGDCTEEVIKGYIERYLSPIQGLRISKTADNGLFSPTLSNMEVTDSMEMECPRYLLSLRLTDEVPYTVSGIMTAKIITALIRQKISEVFFAKGILSESSADRIQYPGNLLTMEFRMATPDSLDAYETCMNATLDALEENGVQKERIDAAKKALAAYLVKQASSGNDYWINMMEARLNGKDFLSERDAALNALSAGEINTALKNFIASSYRNTVRILPQEIRIPDFSDIEFEEVLTQPLDTAFNFERWVPTSKKHSKENAVEKTTDETVEDTVNETLDETVEEDLEDISIEESGEENPTEDIEILINDIIHSEDVPKQEKDTLATKDIEIKAAEVKDTTATSTKSDTSDK